LPLFGEDDSNRVLAASPTTDEKKLWRQARLDRDVAAQPGIESMIVRIGINDIGQPGAGTARPPTSRSAPAGNLTRRTMPCLSANRKIQQWD
jgi:hypothetical protein